MVLTVNLRQMLLLASWCEQNLGPENECWSVQYTEHHWHMVFNTAQQGSQAHAQLMWFILQGKI